MYALTCTYASEWHIRLHCLFDQVEDFIPSTIAEDGGKQPLNVDLGDVDVTTLQQPTVNIIFSRPIISSCFKAIFIMCMCVYVS